MSETGPRAGEHAGPREKAGRRPVGPWSCPSSPSGRLAGPGWAAERRPGTGRGVSPWPGVSHLLPGTEHEVPHQPQAPGWRNKQGPQRGKDTMSAVGGVRGLSRGAAAEIKISHSSVHQARSPDRRAADVIRIAQPQSRDAGGGVSWPPGPAVGGRGPARTSPSGLLGLWRKGAAGGRACRPGSRGPVQFGGWAPAALLRVVPPRRTLARAAHCARTPVHCGPRRHACPPIRARQDAREAERPAGLPPGRPAGTRFPPQPNPAQRRRGGQPVLPAPRRGSVTVRPDAAASGAGRSRFLSRFPGGGAATFHSIPAWVLRAVGRDGLSAPFRPSSHL